jgi:hypothetical protein
MIRRLSMDCKACGSMVFPTIKCFTRYLSDDALAVVCRWRLTMRKIKSMNHPMKRLLVDHVKELCESCKLGVCKTRSLINYDPENFFNVKNFDVTRHQIVSIQQKFEVMTLHDSIVSGATSL